MSKYTTEVRFICEAFAKQRTSVNYTKIDEILKASAPLIFSFDYPIFDGDYKLPLEIKILRYYYTREIGFETVGLWQLKLENKMNMIMPYYNQLYNSELLSFNPLYETDLTRTFKRDNGSTTKENHNSNSSNNNTNYSLFSDTPQGGLEGVDREEYLTTATKNTTQQSLIDTTIDNKQINTLENYIENVKGRQGGTSGSELLNQFRSTFLNVDNMVIKELADLFMGIY